MIEIMSGRVQRLFDCINSTSDVFLANSFLEPCADSDSQGLYIIVKTFNKFLSLDPLILAKLLLIIPFLTSVFIGLKALNVSSNKKLWLFFILFQIAFGLFDYISRAVFVLAEWAMAYWVTLCVLLCISSINKTKNITKIILVTFVVVLGEWIRAGTIYPIITLLLLLSIFSKDDKKWSFYSLISIIFLYCVIKITNNILILELNELNDYNKLIKVKHLFGHSLLIGLGWLDNPFSLKYEDSSGVKYIVEKYNIERKTLYLNDKTQKLLFDATHQYDKLALKEFFLIIMNNSVWFINQLLFKLLKICLFIIITFSGTLIYLKFVIKFVNGKNIFLKSFLEYQFINKIKLYVFILTPTLLISICPGLLVIPSRHYISSSIAICSFLSFLIVYNLLKEKSNLS